MTEHYDVIIIGTGAGGGTLAHRLSGSGKKILILERGGFLPREKKNWDTVSVFQKECYHNSEEWSDTKGKKFLPGTGYWVGGNTKVYGAALFRLREQDFENVTHQGGISPEWPVKYRDFEPYYTEAEKIYEVHGRQGLDPTEPSRTNDFPCPPVSHEPRIQELSNEISKRGYHPFYIPMGVRLNENDPFNSPCIRCDTCDGFPCMVHAKTDSDINGVRPALAKDASNMTLLTHACVTRLITNVSGNEVKEVEFLHEGEKKRVQGNIIAVSCGAINSAVLLLRSANEKHPNGLANSSEQLGRNFMKHVNGAMLEISLEKNDTVFQKTLAINDFYWGEKGYDYPMGHIQLLGKANKEMLAGDAPSFTPKMVLRQMASHSIDWWFTAEDLPDPANRVRLEKGDIFLDYRENNTKSFQRLVKRWCRVLKKISRRKSIFAPSLHLKKKIPLAGVAHQVGTCRFGEQANHSVLDINCKAHDLDNLYVVDGSFFPSSAAVNPSLTIMANSLRVGDHILERLN